MRDLGRWQVLNEVATPAVGEVADQIARDQALATAVGAGGRPPAMRLWRHASAFVLGPRDARLPAVGAARAWLERIGRSVTVRPSGGWAVPLDGGVLNASFVLPVQVHAGGASRYRVEDGFHLVHGTIAAALRHLGVKAERGEVAGGYCPGEFDLSVGGRKFGGMSQRLTARVAIIQAFLLVEGTGAERARLVARFYALAAGADAADLGAPIVSEGAMVSLAEHIGRDLLCADVAALLAGVVLPAW